MGSFRQQPFGGGPRIGDADGEPASAPAASDIGAYGGSPTFMGGIEDRGVDGLNPDASGDIYPDVYGGGTPIYRQSNKVKARGNAAGPGAGATGSGGFGSPS